MTRRQSYILGLFCLVTPSRDKEMPLTAPQKKVAIIVKYFYPVRRPSGISSFVYGLANALARQVDLSVVSAKSEGNDRSGYIHNNYKIYKAKKPFPIEAVKIVNQVHPDTVIIFSGIYQPLRTLLYFGLIALTLKCKKIVFCQTTNYNKERLPWYYKFFLKHFSSVVATNGHMRDQYKKLGIESQMIPPGVDLRLIEMMAGGGIKKNKDIRIGFFGHFYKVKGPDRLLKAFISINSDKAEVIFSGGDGELKNEIAACAEQDQRIKIIGWQKNIFPYLASCDILTLPYRDSYSVLGYSQAALEAMALSIPVIGTPTPSLEFLIKNGYNGYIVKSDQELKDRLEYLINHTDKIRELGRNARQTIVDGHDINNITNEYLNKIV